MTALFHIIIKSTKNSLLELLKKPGKLVLYILVIAGIGGLAFLSMANTVYAENQIPLFWFSGILFVFITIFVIISVIKGISSGDNIFEMNDVNLLFVSPVSQRKILLYGILRLTKVSFLAGFFILFQSSSLASFGINFSGLLLILLAFMLCIMVLTVASLMIYNLTNSNPSRKLIAKVITLLLFIPMLAYFLLQYLGSQDVLPALESTIKSPFMELIPFAGWTAAGVTRLLSGVLAPGLLFLGANLGAGVGLVAYILLSNQDYYEDTLVATETAFQRKRALAEGNINAGRQNNFSKISVAKTGISGFGAAALAGKHLRESFRQSRFGFLTLSSVIIVAGAIAMIAFMKDLITVLQILMWIQIFMIGTGRGLMETYFHYIYMIPESSFKKILWGNMEVMIKTLAESILIFGIGGVMVGANVLTVIFAIAVYTLFSLLLLGINFLSMRFAGANISNGLLIAIYYIAVVIAILPGLVAAMVAGFAVGGIAGGNIGLGILAAWELLVGLGCFALSKGVLHNCDMPTVKPKG